jgi:hypothetical protein
VHRTTRTAALALAVSATLGLAACSDDTAREKAGDPAAGSSTGSGAAAAPCLVTADRLGEILGTGQTVQEVDVPPLGEESEGDLTCETALDENDQQVTWTLSSADMTVGGPLTRRELRAFVEGPDTQVSEVEVGADEPAWLGTSSQLGMSYATTATLQGEQWLKVEVTGDDDTVAVDDASDAAVQVTRALVEAVSTAGQG